MCDLGIVTVPLEPVVPLRLDFPIVMRKNSVKVPRYLTPALAYLVGLFRDGNLSRNYGNFQVRLYNKSTVFLENVVSKIAEVVFGKAGSILDRGGTFVWQLNSKSLYLLFVKLFGYPEGKTQKWWTTPNIILQSPPEIQRWYVAGFTDAEGSIVMEGSKLVIYIYHSWYTSQQCPPLADIKAILSSNGIHSIGPILYRKDVNAFKLKIKGQNAKKFISWAPLLLKFPLF